MPATASMVRLITLLLMAVLAILASPITTSSFQPVSASTCPTTVDSFPVPTFGPTSTAYTSTVTSTKEYDCGGCDSLVVVQLGHIFPDIPVHYTITVTASDPTTFVEALCATSASAVAAAYTPIITVTTTSTASLATVTVESKTHSWPHIGGPDPVCPGGICGSMHLTATVLPKRSENLGGGFQPSRCIDYLTGKLIAGCRADQDINTADKEIEKRQLNSNVIADKEAEAQLKKHTVNCYSRCTEEHTHDTHVGLEDCISRCESSIACGEVSCSTKRQDIPYGLPAEVREKAEKHKCRWQGVKWVCPL